jgi:hypothetical protein
MDQQPQPQPQPQAATPHRPHTHAVATPARPRRHRPVNPPCRRQCPGPAASGHRRTGGGQHRQVHRTPTGGSASDRHARHPADRHRFAPERGFFRPVARTYDNGEVYHYLCDKSFLIKVPASWRELHARGQKLLRLGTAAAEVAERLGVSAERWREIVVACSQRVVGFEVGED